MRKGVLISVFITIGLFFILAGCIPPPETPGASPLPSLPEATLPETTPTTGPTVDIPTASSPTNPPQLTPTDPAPADPASSVSAIEIPFQYDDDFLPGVTIHAVQARHTGDNVEFEFAYISDADRGMSFFDPPSGDIISIQQPIPQGDHAVTIITDVAVLRSVDNITVNFYIPDVELTGRIFLNFSAIEAVLANPPAAAPESPTTGDPASGDPVSGEPRTLTICLGAEPESLSIYQTSMLVAENVFQAIYDGPIDRVGLEYVPVILEKIPSLADDDALIEPITVQEGDPIVDAEYTPKNLTVGDIIRPAGCQSQDCAVTYTGGAVTMDQLRVRFRLLKNVRWNDGTPLTAADSVFGFQIAQNCSLSWDCCGACSAGWIRYREHPPLERTESYTALDAYTVEWVGQPGFLDPEYQTNFWHPMPKHQLESFDWETLFQLDEVTRQPLGWGPYQVEEWHIGHRISLTKNPYYFRAAEGLPAFDRLVFELTGQNTGRNLAMMLNGECDLLDLNAHIADQFALFDELDKQGLIQLHAEGGRVFEQITFGIVPASYDDGYDLGIDRPDFFGDPRTRHALATCMDRQALVDELLLGHSQVLNTYGHPAHPLYDDAGYRHQFDIENGIALLEEVGWVDPDEDPDTPRIAQGVPNVPDGTPFVINFWTTTATRRQEAAQMLAANLAECGVQTELEFWPPGEFYGDGETERGLVFGRQFDLAMFAWVTDTPPPCDLFLTEAIPNEADGWLGSNAAGYGNPEIDAACDTALSLLPGQPGYAEAHREAQAIFAQDLPVLPLYLRLWETAARADFCGYQSDPNAGSDTWNIEEFNYGEGCE